MKANSLGGMHMRGRVIAALALTVVAGIHKPVAGSPVPLPEGRLLLTACPEGQGRYGDLCTEPSTDPNGYKLVAPELMSLGPDGETQITTNRFAERGSSAVSPDGRFVAVSDDSIYDSEECTVELIDLSDGGSDELLPYEELACPMPQDWSSNGRWILLVISQHDGPSDLYKVRPDGTDLTPLKTMGGELSHIDGAAFLDGGRRIVYWGSFPRRRDGIRIMRADGEHVRTVVELVHRRKDAPRLLAAAPSPNERRIVYSTDDGDPMRSGTDDAYVIRLDGTGRRRLTDDPRNEMKMAWGPKSRRLAVYKGDRFDIEAPTRIAVMRPNGDVMLTVAVPKGAELFRWSPPIWSPSGRFFAFEAQNADGVAIFVVEAATGETILVRDYDDPSKLLAWSSG